MNLGSPESRSLSAGSGPPVPNLGARRNSILQTSLPSQQLFPPVGFIIRRYFAFRGVPMRSITTRAVLLLSCLILAVVVPQLLAKKKVRPPDTPTEQKRAAHALNRLTFGPRPGEVEQVMAIGVDRWIDLELHPEKIADNHLESRLTPLRTPSRRNDISISTRPASASSRICTSAAKT